MHRKHWQTIGSSNIYVVDVTSKHPLLYYHGAAYDSERILTQPVGLACPANCSDILLRFTPVMSCYPA
jgi:hypothetical protein